MIITLKKQRDVLFKIRNAHTSNIFAFALSGTTVGWPPQMRRPPCRRDGGRGRCANLDYVIELGPQPRLISS